MFDDFDGIHIDQTFIQINYKIMLNYITVLFY